MKNLGVIFIAIVISCSVQRSAPPSSSCTLEQAIAIAKTRYAGRVGVTDSTFDSLYNTSYLKNDKGYYIRFSLKNLSVGGESADFAILKDECDIVEERFDN